MFFAVDSGEGRVVVEGLIDFLAVDVVEVGGWVAGGGMEDAVDPAHEVFVEGSGDADVVPAIAGKRSWLRCPEEGNVCFFVFHSLIFRVSWVSGLLAWVRFCSFSVFIREFVWSRLIC